MARVSGLGWLCVDADAEADLQLWDGVLLARVDTLGLVVHHSVIGVCLEFEGLTDDLTGGVGNKESCVRVERC